MTTPPAPTQAELWNGPSGATWVELQALTDRTLEPFLAPLLDTAFPGAGGRVLDVGCGAGATTLAMARRVGPQGVCLGVDISGPLIEAAGARAGREGADNARFVCADAQTAALAGEDFDAAMSRFGVMFFDDPVAAFANLRGALRPGGKLVVIAWRSPMENPLFSAPALAAARFLPPALPPQPHAPGQFAFADRARVEGILGDAGWRDAAIEPLDVPTPIAADDLTTMMSRMGPAAAALRDQPEPVRADALAAMREAVAPFVHDGVGRFTAACWLITARA